MEERQVENKMARLVKWMGVHPEVQAKLCDSGYEAKPAECIEIMDMLEAQGFYELIYVLLIKNQQDWVISGVLEKLLAEAWAQRWETAGNRGMIRELRELISREMELREKAAANA